jgi:hypothetical protein
MLPGAEPIGRGKKKIEKQEPRKRGREIQEKRDDYSERKD